MERGYVKTWRCSADNPLYFAESFSKWQAWQDIILLANYKESSMFKRGITITVPRGSLAWSKKALQDRWKWSSSKVTCFLNMLKKEGQIEYQINNVTTLITILNYEVYQEEANQKQTKSKPKAQQKQTSKEGKEGKEGKKPCAVKDTAPNKFDLFWDAFDYKRGKEDARKSFNKIKLTDHLFNSILTAAKTEAKNRQTLIDKGSTPKMAQGWLTSKRWEDEQSSVATKHDPYNSGIYQ